MRLIDELITVIKEVLWRQVIRGGGGEEDGEINDGGGIGKWDEGEENRWLFSRQERLVRERQRASHTYSQLYFRFPLPA